MKMPDFLKSNRFWALVLLAVSFYLDKYGFTLDSHGVAVLLEMVAGGHVGLRTVDRFAEKFSRAN